MLSEDDVAEGQELYPGWVIDGMNPSVSRWVTLSDGRRVKVALRRVQHNDNNNEQQQPDNDNNDNFEPPSMSAYATQMMMDLPPDEGDEAGSDSDNDNDNSNDNDLWNIQDGDSQLAAMFKLKAALREPETQSEFRQRYFRARKKYEMAVPIFDHKHPAYDREPLLRVQMEEDGGFGRELLRAPPRNDNFNYNTESPEEVAFIDEMIAAGILQQSEEVSHVIPCFFIAEKRTADSKPKLRFIADCRQINDCMNDPPTFKMHGISTIRRIVSNNNSISNIDIKSAFYHMALAHWLRKFMCVRVNGQTYQFTRLPMGWKWSPFFMHLMVDPIVKYVREMGIDATHYADDVTVGEDDGVHNAEVVTKTFEAAGIRVNRDKCIFGATEVIDILGMRWNVREKTVDWITAEDTARRVSDVMIRRHIDGFVGRFAFVTGLAKGMRHLYQPILLERQKYDGVIPREQRRNVRRKLRKCIAKMRERFPMTISNYNHDIHINIVSDATPISGAYIIEATSRIGTITLRDEWIDWDQVERIRRNEPIEIIMVMEARAMQRAYERVFVQWSADGFTIEDFSRTDWTVRCDNMALVYALKKGRSKVKYVNDFMGYNLDLCAVGAKLKYLWVPSEENEADAPSRNVITDYDLEDLLQQAEGAPLEPAELAIVVG